MNGQNNSVQSEFNTNECIPTDSRSVARMPEMDLAEAILVQAMIDYFNTKELFDFKSRRIYREVKAWIFNNSESIYSFQNICHFLNLDPDAVREAILNS